ncbi:Nramp family divalent metal transporter [Singulisphaera sp. PoT]|uniref:Nramp family divalent metal transporter n=1 Tax=Singulisphaera sp. PoT TaxID=3411797 RepID=UPI003BF5673E
MTEESSRVRNEIPPWDVADLPKPHPLEWRHWTRYVGPGIVMMGIQIGGGEWLLGPEVTAKYGGGLMWIATIAIVLQVFYNLECGRYALYCGEPIFTGFLRTRPGPRFWMGIILFLNLSSLIPGLSTHGAALLASLYLDRPPGAGDRWLVTILAYAMLLAVALPILVGGKVYNMLQAIMTVKVTVVLGFCLTLGICYVSPENWWKIFSGFVKFGTVPTVVDGHDTTVNVFLHVFNEGTWPLVALSNIAVIGAFAGYAGGGGLSNSAYGNFVRDKGWGMGSVVGAIPSAIGGRHITLSHVGKVFKINAENLAKWKGWWRYILVDQVYVWAPGCFMGMALPGLLSLQFAPYSLLQGNKLEWAQALITADGIRHAPQFAMGVAKVLWITTVFVGLLVMLPSQMSIVDDFSRRWTDILWSGSRRVRGTLRGNAVKRIYYSILAFYVLWNLVCAYLFSTYGTPKLMTLVIANLNNVSIGVTSFHLLWINCKLLPEELRPRWYHRAGVIGCGVFYLGLALLVFVTKQLPMFREMLGG